MSALDWLRTIALAALIGVTAGLVVSLALLTLLNGKASMRRYVAWEVAGAIGWWSQVRARVQAWRRRRGGWLYRDVNGMKAGESRLARMRQVARADLAVVVQVERRG